METGIILINNNGYGASELKKSYQAFTFKGFLIALTIHIALIAGYMLLAYINESNAKDIPIGKDIPRIVDIRDVLPPSMDETEIPEVKKEEIAKVKDLSALQPEPVKREIADDVKLKTQDDLNKMEGNAGRDSLIASNTTPHDTKIDDTKLDNILKKDQPVKDTYKEFEVEKAPVCINLAQVKSSLHYPETAVETGAEGKVTVKILVGEDGNVLKIGTLTGNDIFYDEVKEKSMNLQFTPGLQNNNPVKVWVTVPFSFKLK